MSEAEEEEESSEREIHENQCGVILGYWDHEKTPTLIKELENSVGVIEEKCKTLLEELIYYKKFLEESKDLKGHFLGFKDKNDKPKSQCSCGSEPDLVLRKNLINSQEKRQLFEEKLQQKLSCINRELAEVAQKIGLKNNIVLFPTNEYLKTINAQIENEAEKSWCDVRENFIAGHFFEQPEPVTGRGRDAGVSKITKNELDLYLNLSKLNVNGKRWKGRNRPVSAVKKRTIGGSWKVCKVRQDVRASTFEHGKSEKTKFRKRRSRVTVPRMRMWPSGGKSEIERVGGSPVEFFSGSGKVAEGGVILEGVDGKMGQRTSSRILDVCQIGKQLPNFRKRGVRASASENLGGKTGGTITSLGGATHLEKRRAVLRIPSDTEKETSKRNLKLGGDLCPAERRKAQSSYTCNLAEGFRENLRPRAMRRTDGRRSAIKSLSNGARVAGSKITSCGFQRVDVFEMGKDGSGFEKASGDCSAKRSKERTYRKCSWQKKTTRNCGLAPDDKELKSIEDEVDRSLHRYQKLLEFYSKFLCLDQEPGEVTNNDLAGHEIGNHGTGISCLPK